MRPRRPAAALLLLAPALLVALAPAARAQPPASRRTVAVLEFRAGATGATEIGARLAGLLRRQTALTVVDPQDARRIGGARVDQDLARCAGEPTCVARIGRALGADEVVLVGVSELGDLILALQRVDARGGEVRSRVAESLPRGVEPDDEALGGYLRRLLPPEDFRRYGTIRVRANVDGADVFLGGRRRGTTPIDPLVVRAPARVDLRVAKQGYLDFTARIEVPPEATVEVRPVLALRDDAWYRKWWVWAAIGGVAAGAAIGGAILLAPERTHVPVGE